jgi:hypothetical protein
MSDDRAVTGSGIPLEAWLALVARTGEWPDATVGREERSLLLDLARISARRCERIAAPITAYMVGAALANATPAGRAEHLRRLVAELDERS